MKVNGKDYRTIKFENKIVKIIADSIPNVSATSAENDKFLFSN